MQFKGNCTKFVHQLLFQDGEEKLGKMCVLLI